MGSSASPQPFWPKWVSETSKAGPTACHLITSAASVRLCELLRHRLRLGFHLRSSLKGLFHLYEVPRLKASPYRGFFEYNGNNFVHFAKDAFFSSYSPSFCFFNGEHTRMDSKNEEGSNSETLVRDALNRRQWTNALLAINVLIHVGQIATQGKLLLWGAKVNSLIDKGQLWRLVTSSVLHANIGHLMINCYSLNSVGPAVENISGPKRFLAVYLTSAIASSAMSYLFSKAPSVGASGAIFGLVGSVAVFVLRHRRMLRGGNEGIQEIAQVITLNMAMGLLSRGIDNWGHIGGFLGGAATSWLLGPAWKFESTSVDGRKILADRAPVFNLINKSRQR